MTSDTHRPQATESVPSSGPASPHASAEPPADWHATEPDSPERRQAARSSGLQATIALGLLVLHLVLWETVLAPVKGGSGLLALKALPLAMCLAGYWRQTLYTFRVVCLLLWLYVMEALVRGPSDHGVSALCAWTELALCLVVFALSVRHIQTRIPRRKRR